MKYNHAEAFCQMTYECEKCKTKERLWNSRDGVTPFIIMCRNGDCDGHVLHIDFHTDERRPHHYRPENGSRVFIDLTPEKHYEYELKKAKRFMEMADRGDKICKKVLKDYDSIEELARSTKMEKGAPDVIVMGEYFTEEYFNMRMKQMKDDNTFDGTCPFSNVAVECNDIRYSKCNVCLSNDERML